MACGFAYSLVVVYRTNAGDQLDQVTKTANIILAFVCFILMKLNVYIQPQTSELYGVRVWFGWVIARSIDS